jgi:hypothetical protein
MARRDPPRYVQHSMADHLRRAHHIAKLDLTQVGMRTARRGGSIVRWHPGADDPLGASYRCQHCRDTHGEGWDRYYAAVYWPYPLPHHQTAIHAHYQHYHPRTRFDPQRINTPGHAVADWLATLIPLTPHAPAAFLCAACRPANADDGPALAPRTYFGTDAYGDARRLQWLRATRSDLHPDLAGRSPLQQAELLEARDRGLVLRDLNPKTIHAAVTRARTSTPQAAKRDYLEEAMITLLGEARDRGEKPTPVIHRLATLARERSDLFTTLVGQAIPTLAAQKPVMTPNQFRQCVRAHLNTPTNPTISERRLWHIWATHVRHPT